MPVLHKLAQGTDALYVQEELPLIRGDRLTARQEALLAIPPVSPEILAKLQHENDELMKKVGDDLEEASKH